MHLILRTITALLFSSVSLISNLPAHAQQKGLLWQITGKNITAPTYLYGTVHLFDTTLYRLPEPVFTKLSQTKLVMFELDFGKINPMEMMNGIMVKDSTQRLDKLLDAASLVRLQEIIKTLPMLQMLGKNAYRLKPMFLYSFLINDGKTPSIDMEMYKRAQALKDSVGGLETLAEQMQAIDDIPVSKQAEMLQDALKNFTSPAESIRKLTAIYVKQDIANLMKDMSQDMPVDASFNESLLIKRNIVMANRIDALLGKQSTLIAVGAAHLAGNTGLITLLQQKGYQLKSIPFAFTKTVTK